MCRRSVKKSGGQENQALGRSRGGFSTKIHASVDALGNPLRFLLTGGQRPAYLAPAIQGIAEELPLDDQSVDAAMALITVHQWSDLQKGLSELCRATRGPILILTFDRDALNRYWLADYVPELIAVEYKRYPPIQTILSGLRGSIEVQSVSIPIDCVDGFTEAFYARPERFLDLAVRQAQSAWGFVEPSVQERFERALGEDLHFGAWDTHYGDLREKPSFDGSLRLIVSRPARLPGASLKGV